MIMEEVKSGYWKGISETDIGGDGNEVQDNMSGPERGELGNPNIL
jgi:hypothetical protein